MFSEELNPGTEVTTSAITAFETYGIYEAFEFPHTISDLPLDENAANWALRQIRKLNDDRDDNLPFHLFRWICLKASPQLLRQFMPELKIVADQGKSGKLSFQGPLKNGQLRLDLDDLPGNECFARLHQTLKSCEDSDDFPTKLISDAELICQRLIGTEETRTEVERLALEWLAFDFSEETQWHSGIAIYLIGLLQIESAIPRLIEYFDYDFDWWNESIQEALKRMKTPATIKLCEEIYPTLEWHGRLYLTSMFESPTIPEAEATVLRLLKTEDNDDLRVDLATSLVLFGTPQAQKIARSVLLELPSDPERFVIAEILYYQFILQGIDDPDLKKWRLRMEAMRIRMGKGIDDWNNAPDFLDRTISISNTPIRAEITPGRNDLCPCGSGKKFKKCCLNR